MLQCEGVSSKLRYYFEIPNGDNVRNCVANVVIKFHDNPTVNEYEIVDFLRVGCEKKWILKGEGEKRK